MKQVLLGTKVLFYETFPSFWWINTESVSGTCMAKFFVGWYNPWTEFGGISAYTLKSAVQHEFFWSAW